MFEILVASVVPARRSPLQVCGAIGIHAVLLLAAIVVSRRAALADPAPGPDRFPPDVYINRTTPAPSVRSTTGTQAVSPARPELPTHVPLPGISIPGVTTQLPPTDFDPSSYAGTSTMPSDIDGGPGPSAGLATLPRNDEVDQPARRLHVVQPIYPTPLRVAGIEGTVRLSFIIDTLGVVEPGSVTVLAVSHPGFVASATEAIRAQRFIPARRRGVVVRTLAQQTVRFALGGDGPGSQP